MPACAWIRSLTLRPRRYSTDPWDSSRSCPITTIRYPASCIWRRLSKCVASETKGLREIPNIAVNAHLTSDQFAEIDSDMARLQGNGQPTSSFGSTVIYRLIPRSGGIMRRILASCVVLVLLQLPCSVAAQFGGAASSAIAAGDAEWLTSLLDDGLDANSKGLLHRAVLSGHMDMVTMLLKAGADVNQERGSYSFSLKRPITPLAKAVEIENLDMLKLLINAGAKVNVNAYEQRNKTTVKVLHRAVFAGNLKVAQLLLEAGADIQATGNWGAGDRTWRGVTPLHSAVWSKEVAPVQLLLAAGADVNAKETTNLRGTISNITPLHFAARNGYFDIVVTLIRAGADVNAVASESGGVGDGATPVHFAAYYGHVDVVLALLAARANPALANTGGYTPLHKVREKLQNMRERSYPYARVSNSTIRNMEQIEQTLVNAGG